MALCTCNGGSFLREQLDSIAAQTLAPGELVVCDDCSTDDSPALLEEFARRAVFPVRIYRNESRLGVVRNYSRAVELCRGRYVALCDQDDIWQPDKLAVSRQGMREAEAELGGDIPLLLHTDLAVAAGDGAIIAPSLMKLQKINHVCREPLKTLLVQNFVTGCTVLLNRPLIKAALPLPAQVLMHDWWFALIAAALGKLIFLPRPTVLYRQHARNAVGAKKFYSGSSLKRLARVRQLERMIAQTVNQGLALKKRLDELNCQEPSFLEGYLATALHDGKKAASYARSYGIAKQGRLRNAFFLLLLYKSGYLMQLGDQRAVNCDHR
ncbi:MAG: glycosyltransferase family 2 protein [Bacillota bacterium]